MEDDFFYITLNCQDCDHPTCHLNSVMYGNYKDGCVRKVDEDLFIEYYHQLKEVWPFALKESKEIKNKEYKKTIETLYKIYNSPCIKRYGKGFKVIVGV